MPKRTSTPSPTRSIFKVPLKNCGTQFFQSGEFNGVEFGPATPEEALRMTVEDGDGTRSILDIMQVADAPNFCCAAPLTPDELQRYFGHGKPTREQLKQAGGFWEDIERGHCRVIVLYHGDEPTQLYFAGYSFD